MTQDNEKTWEDTVEKAIIDGLRAIENADGDPLSAFRRQVTEAVVVADGVNAKEADCILALIGAC